MSDLSASEIGSLQRTVRDLQTQMKKMSQEADKEADKVREKHESVLDRSYRNNRENIEDLHEDHADALKSQKDASNAVLRENRKSYLNQLSDLQQNAYNRYGQINAAEARELREKLAATNRSVDQENEQSARRIRDMEGNYERRLADQARNYEGKIEDAIRETRDSIRQANHEREVAEKKGYLDTKGQLEEEYTKLAQTTAQEKANTLRYARHAVDDAERQVETRLASAREDKEAALQRQHDAMTAKIEESMLANARQKDAEGEKFREQISKLTEVQRAFHERQGEDRASVIKQFADDHRAREQAIVKSYESQLEREKMASKAAARKVAQNSREAVVKQAEQYTKAFQDQNAENHVRIKTMQETFTKNREQMEETRRKDQLANDKLAESRMIQNDQKQMEAMEEQREAFRRSASMMRRDLQDQIKGLEKDLHHQQSSSDVSVVHPNVEHAIRTTVGADYEKVLDEEIGRNQRDRESLRENHSKTIGDIQRDAIKEKETIVRQAQFDKDAARRQLVDLAQEAEYVREKELGIQEQAHQRETEKINKSFYKMLEDQRRQYEEILHASRLDSAQRIASMRQKDEFEERMLRREFTAKINDISTRYERELEAKDEEHSELLSIAKDEADRKVRAKERESRMILEKQENDFEQRLAQLEFAQKERKRALEQNFEEQLEKIRRANARIVAQKS